MKKIGTLISALLFMFLMTSESIAGPRPFYLSIRIGFLAKWAITFDDCEPGGGLCISFPDGPEHNFLGFDSDNRELSIRILKTGAEAKYLEAGVLEVKEDSPVDPAVTRQFPYFAKLNKVLVVKKGSYKIQDDGDFFLIPINYFLQ